MSNQPRFKRLRRTAWDTSGMETAVYVLVAAVTFAVTGLVFWLFVWAARKDGAEDRAVQSRLGIKRKTRLGR
jgi:hypothetical protein